MVTKTWTTIRTDRGLTAAHGGALLGSRTATPAVAKRINGVSPMVAFAPAYAPDQESHPPRGCSPA